MLDSQVIHNRFVYFNLSDLHPFRLSKTIHLCSTTWYVLMCGSLMFLQVQLMDNLERCWKWGFVLVASLCAQEIVLVMLEEMTPCHILRGIRCSTWIIIDILIILQDYCCTVRKYGLKVVPSLILVKGLWPSLIDIKIIVSKGTNWL
jgi:hypothetical protein